MNTIIKSWEINAYEWNRIIEEEKIPSRKFTNKAILNKLVSLKASNILDLGCGEGWLTRLLIATHHNSVTGVDATQMLIEIAKKKGKGNFYQFTYNDIISSQKIPNAPFDVMVFNFSIYSVDEELIQLFKSIKSSLTKHGKIIIQTIHPYFLVDKKLPYKSQDIENAWEGLDGNFTHDHSWYARTFSDWIAVFHQAGLKLISTEEVLNDNKPVSIIFELKIDFETN